MIGDRGPLAYIREIEVLLDKLQRGGKPKPLDLESAPDELRGVAMRINGLLSDMLENQYFVNELVAGNLGVKPPGRRNYLSAPMKEMHSQLSGISWSICQLVQGNMVSKLYYPGELYQAYNQLVQKISASFSQINEGAEGDGLSAPTNSWRYHQLLSALNHLHIMIIEVDESGRIIFANPPVRELLRDPSALPYSKPEEQDSGIIRYLCSFEHASSAPPQGKLFNEDYPVFHELHYNNGFWYKITTESVRMADGTYGFLHMIDDISEWKRHEKRLTISATIDSLTGAYNRGTGVLLVEELVKSGNGETHCIVFIDLDNLKHINDTFGHHQGDHAIKSLVALLFDTIRETDSVIRYGGDEFLVIFRNCEEESVVAIMKRMSERAAHFNDDSDLPYTLSFSYGITRVSGSETAATELISLADERMYRNKLKKKANIPLLDKEDLNH